jgi:hypothetical protein
MLTTSRILLIAATTAIYQCRHLLTGPKILALVGMIIFLITLALLLETLQQLAWYKSKFYATPRVKECPYKYSTISKVLLGIFFIKPIKLV